MNKQINMVVFNLEEMLGIVLGDGIPTQLLDITEMDEWSSIVDDTGEPIWDIQIWEDLDRNPTTGEYDVPIWGCQYVNLIKLNEPNGHQQYEMGYEWNNPIDFMMTDIPIAVVIKDMELTIDIETENI